MSLINSAIKLAVLVCLGCCEGLLLVSSREDDDEASDQTCWRRGEETTGAVGFTGVLRREEEDRALGLAVPFVPFV